MKSTALAIHIRSLDKFLDRKHVLKSVDLEVRPGEVFGFLGPNGAGKTTTMKCILRLILPDAGVITILGHDDLSRDARKKIGFMPENTYLYKYLTGREFLRFNGEFFDIPADVLEAKIEKLLIKVGLHEAGDKLLAKYSKGMLQRIGLAQAIINDPEIVFLDEPMSGLDPIGRRMVKDLIIDLKKSGTTVFFNTHVLPDVEDVCDRFAIIHRGEIIASEDVKTVHGTLEDYFIKKIQQHTEGELEVR